MFKISKKRSSYDYTKLRSKIIDHGICVSKCSNYERKGVEYIVFADLEKCVEYVG